MYHVIATALLVGSGSFLEGVLGQYKNEWFWQSYVASALITFPIVLVIIGINNGQLAAIWEKIEKRLTAVREDTSEQLAALRDQLDGMNENMARLYRRIAEKGDAEAQFDLGRCHELGLGVAKDAALAVEWYRKAAEQGHAGAQCRLGRCHAEGLVVEKNLEQAAEWYRRSAGQGYAEAQCEWGLCLEFGAGVPKDPERAAEWYRRSAEQGYAEARSRMLLCGKNNSGGVITVALPGGVDLALVKVEGGAFTLGSPSDEKGRCGDETPRQVTLTRDFCIGRTTVTQKQWRALMGSDPSYFDGDDLPVEMVSRNAATAFCDKLNDLGLAPKGYMFTLPTEAQWEYAARGGGASKGYKYSGSDDLGEVGWFFDNSSDKPHPVAQKKANELGLYDMSGNVWEWCRDRYEKGYSADPEFLAGNSGAEYVIRGGDYGSAADACRAACRRISGPGSVSNELGFRVALVPVD